MTRTRAPHRLSWEQLTLVPPALVTAELTLHYDGRSDALQTAWRIRCTETDAVIGMEVSATASNARDTLRVTRAARMLHERALGVLGPF